VKFFTVVLGDESTELHHIWGDQRR